MKNTVNQSICLRGTMPQTTRQTDTHTLTHIETASFAVGHFKWYFTKLLVVWVMKQTIEFRFVNKNTA